MTKQEKIFVWVLAAVVILITTAPVFVGSMLAPEKHVFTALHNFTTGDTATYYSFIEQGRDGHVLFKNLYTSESHDRVLLSPLWLVLGWIGKLLPLPAPVLYHAARVLLIPLFLFLLYRVVSKATHQQPIRYLAMVLLSFGSGIGFLFGNMFDGNGIHMPVDLWVPEAITFSTLYHSPLLIASLTLLMATLFLFYRGITENKLPFIFIGGGLGTVLFVLHPFYVPTVYVVTGTLAFIYVLRKQTTFFSMLRQYSLYILCTIPALIYFFWLYTTQDVFRAWATGNILSSPHPLFYILGFGLFIPFAIVGVLRREDKKKTTFALIWLIGTAVLLYAPFDFQRRLVEGIHIPLGIFAAIGVATVWEYVRKRWSVFAPVIAVVLAFGFFMSPLTLIVQDIGLYQTTPAYPFYIPEDDVRAMEWIDAETNADAVVLSDVFWTGNFIPWVAVRMSFVGHGPQTIRLQEKQQDVYRFFSEVTSDLWRRQFLEAQGITHILYTPTEQQLGGFDPFAAAYLEQVFYSGSTSVFAVRDEMVTIVSASGVNRK